MKEYSTSEIIKGILRRKDGVIRYVYRKCYPDIRKLVLTNGGNNYDAEDVFQEAMIRVYLNIREKDLILKCKFGTYLYSVCRFLWLQELEKRSSALKKYIPVPDEVIDNDFANHIIRENTKMKLYEKHFRELPKECQKVLNMYFSNASMEEISVVMGYKNVQIAKDKKYRCKKSLMDKIYNNPVYKTLHDEIYLAG